MNCPECGSSELSFPPQRLGGDSTVECGDCAWIGQTSEIRKRELVKINGY